MESWASMSGTIRTEPPCTAQTGAGTPRIRVKGRPMRRSFSLIPFLIVLALLAAAIPASARSQIALGIADPDGADPSVLQAHISSVGAKPALWALWSSWGNRAGKAACEPGFGDCAFPVDTATMLLQRGITPVLWWQPTDPAHPKAGVYESYRRINTGKHDAYIRQWARDAKAASLASGGRRIIVRFAHEATGHWFPWSIGRVGNTRKNYKAAWRHIDKLFRQVGARKYVRFMWSNIYPVAWAYPGDKVVDYVGITILNWGAYRKWKSMPAITRGRVTNTLKFTKKPIILAEVASHYQGGNKARWIKSGYLTVYKRHPKVKAIMYLDTDEPHLAGGQPDWRLVLPADDSAMSAYRKIASMSRFKGHIK